MNAAAEEFLQSVLTTRARAWRPLIAMARCGRATPGSVFSTGNCKAGRFCPRGPGCRPCASAMPPINAARWTRPPCAAKWSPCTAAFPRRTLMAAATAFFDAVLCAADFSRDARTGAADLQQNGCEVWAVSSSNEWVIRAGMKHFGIPENRILAAKVEVEAGVATEPSDPRSLWRWQAGGLARSSQESRSTPPLAIRAGIRKCWRWRSMPLR